MSWADNAARQANDDDGRQRLENELELRKQKIKDERGPDLLQELVARLEAEVEKFNSIRGKQELRLTHQTMPERDTGFYGDLVQVSRLDGQKSPLKLMYSRTSHILSYQCGAGNGQFTLQIDSHTNAPYFEGPYHRRFSISEIGDFILSLWEKAQF
jgi:hypothetical protein